MFIYPYLLLVPADAIWTAWSSWANSSDTSCIGVETKTRVCSSDGVHGGKMCNDDLAIQGRRQVNIKLI